MDFAVLAHTSSVRLARAFGGLAAGALVACSGATGAASGSAAPSPKPSSSTSSLVAADPATLDALDRAERTLATAAGDCAAACDALRAIVDARTRLCAPKSDACDDARAREDEARRTTNETCGDCGGGD